MSDHAPFKVTVEQSIIGVVQRLDPFDGKFGPSYGIDLDTGAGVYHVIEGKAQVDRQLTRIGLGPDTVIGRTIKMWKRPMDEDPTRGYLNIDLMDAPRVQPPSATPTKPASPAAAVAKPANQEAVPDWLVPETKEAKIKQQAEDDATWCWNKAWHVMQPKIEGAGGVMSDPMTLQAVQAMAVGLMIRLEHARR